MRAAYWTVPNFDGETTPLMQIVNVCLGLTARSFEDAQLQLDAAKQMDTLLDLEQLLTKTPETFPVMEL